MTQQSVFQLPGGVRFRDGGLLDPRTRHLSDLMEAFLSRDLDISQLDPDLPPSLLNAGVSVGLKNALHSAADRHREGHNLEFGRLLYSDALRDDPVLVREIDETPLSTLLAPRDVRRVAIFACGWGAGVQQLAERQRLDVTGFTSELSQTELRLTHLQEAGWLRSARVVHTDTVTLTSADTFDAVYCPRAEFRDTAGASNIAQLVERLAPGGQLLVYWMDSERGITRRRRAWRQVATALGPRDWTQTMSLARFARRVAVLGCVMDDAGDATDSLRIWLDEQLRRWEHLEAEVCLAFGEREFRTQRLLRSFAVWACEAAMMRYRWALLRRR